MSQLALVRLSILQIKIKKKKNNINKRKRKEKKNNNDLAIVASHDTVATATTLLLK